MKEDKPRVSIGMPVYNGEKYISEAIDSLLAQTFRDFELIISDNGSTDKTGEICKACAAKDPRVRYYRNEKNRGASWNYNRVFELSSGEYFQWAAADDVWGPEFLSKCVKVLDEDPSIILAYTRVSKIDEMGKFFGHSHGSSTKLIHANSPKTYERFYRLIYFSHSCNTAYGVIRRDILSKTSLMGNHVSSDRVLIAQLGLLGRFYEVPEFLFFWRWHPLSSRSIYSNMYWKTEWFDPNKKNRPVFPWWRLFFAYFASINRIALKWSQKIVCYLQVIRWLRRYGAKMMKDLYIFLVHLKDPHLRVYSRETSFDRYFIRKKRLQQSGIMTR